LEWRPPGAGSYAIVPTNPDGRFDGQPVTQPVLWLPLDAAGGASADGTPVGIWEWADVAQQRWTHNAASRVRLFDGGSLDAFQNADGTAPAWPVSDGSAEALGGDIRTKQTFGDFTLHAEFWLPNLPADVTGQARANSGVYLQDRYEVQ
jgi:hypothetical protein